MKKIIIINNNKWKLLEKNGKTTKIERRQRNEKIGKQQTIEDWQKLSKNGKSLENSTKKTAKK